MAKKQRAALICRVSTPKQVKLGLESQVSVLKRQAVKDGYEVPDELIFQEQISGLDANKPIRKSLQDLMDAVEEHRVDVCYTYELTRISRDPYNLVERVKWFTDRQIPMYIYDVEMWTLDRKTKEEFEETTEYVFSAATYGKVEAKKIKQRMTRARNEVAKEGLYVGHLSDGYCVVLTERGKEIRKDNERESVIHRIFDLYEQGKSTDRIAEILNNDDVPTANRYRSHSPKFKGYVSAYRKKGSELLYSREEAKWQGTMISAYLKNKWYVGKRSYNEGVYSIEPIISAEQWKTVSGMIEENAQAFRSKKESSKHFYLLSGLIYCGICGRRLYGHYTGLNNHYYCSSFDEGAKCGLKGVCKENVEAIIYNTIREYAYSSVIFGESNAVTDYFKLNRDEERKIKEKIRDNERTISDLERETGVREDEITRLLDEKTSRPDRAVICEKLISEREKKNQNDRTKIDKLQAANRGFRRRLNSNNNIKQILKSIKENKELPIIRELFKQAIERVLLFNTEKSNDIIRLIYTNGKVSEIIYSSGLLKSKYIILPYPLYYNEKANIIESKYYPIGITMNAFYYEDDSPSDEAEALMDEHYINRKNAVHFDSIYERMEFLYKGQEYVIYEKGFSVDEYIRLVRNGRAQSYERLEEESELAKTQREHYKQWRKKYNTGNPKGEPWVLRNETYKTIEKKRKKLYNRKGKILKNKSLSKSEKERLIEDIIKQRDILSVQVPRLRPRKKKD